jgi:hypothetical protein
VKRGEIWTVSGGAKRLGKLNDEDVVRLNRALTVFLGLAR